ncbi:hypothetical protein J4468_00595 [Candidatus Woesearchaeota archaeon]|nr:hypothetical protein [Candidatus Woesearchaeota archaeon]
MVDKKNNDSKINGHVERVLASNMHLLKKEIELIEQMKKLTHKVGALVDMFDNAARLVEKHQVAPLSTDREFIDKMEAMLARTNDVQKGLMLLEKYVRDKATSSVETKKGPMPEQRY